MSLNLDDYDISYIIRCMDAYKSEWSFSDDEDCWDEHDRIRDYLASYIGGYTSLPQMLAMATIAKIEEERAKAIPRTIDYRELKEIAKDEGFL